MLMDLVCIKADLIGNTEDFLDRAVVPARGPLDCFLSSEMPPWASRHAELTALARDEAIVGVPKKLVAGVPCDQHLNLFLGPGSSHRR
jgi:hypothetical protein